MKFAKRALVRLYLWLKTLFKNIMKFKKGDKILIIRGKDRGKTGPVLKSLPKQDKLVIEGLNLITRHVRPKRAGEKGQRIKVPNALHVSNVKIICPKCKKVSRIGYLKQGDKKKRVCKKCKAALG